MAIKNRLFHTVVKFHTQQLAQQASLLKQHSTQKISASSTTSQQTSTTTRDQTNALKQKQNPTHRYQEIK
jgi:hypothetical protein